VKIDNLIAIMQGSDIKLPKGTGRSGSIVVRDLENAIGDFYLARDYAKNTAEHAHIQLRRAWTPMKAYRFSSLNKQQQAEVFEDANDWYAERKLNGWRMMVTFIPRTAPMFWGGNLSTVNFLPTNYTNHILFKTKDFPDGVPVSLGIFKYLFPKNTFILDCEVIVKDKVEDLSEHYSLIQVQEILGSSTDRARLLQANSTLQFKIFDVIFPDLPSMRYEDRKFTLLDVMSVLRSNDLTQFSLVPHYLGNKKRYVNKIWKEGGEGIILKKGSASYLPGSRLRTHQIKVKRTHSGAVGDDIDAFITKVYSTPEWSKKGLIGGVELSLYISSGESLKQHIIAAVTSIPDDIRQSMTDDPSAWLNSVVVVDGQELSARNRRLLHARVDWERGRRTDKNPGECIMELEEIEGVKF
jgi:hypothetical protein